MNVWDIQWFERTGPCQVRFTYQANMEEGMLEKTVTKDGKVGGLTKHAGKAVMIVVSKGKDK